MPQSDEATRVPSRFDWQSWAALGWVIAFGTLYARMVLQTRAPGAWEAVRRLIGLD